MTRSSAWELQSTEARVTDLAETLRTRLDRPPGVTMRDLGARRCGLVTFTLDGIDPREAMLRLRERAVNVSVANPHSTLLDSRQRQLPDLLRASVRYYNTEGELDRLCTEVGELTGTV